MRDIDLKSILTVPEDMRNSDIRPEELGAPIVVTGKRPRRARIEALIQQWYLRAYAAEVEAQRCYERIEAYKRELVDASD